MNKMKTIFLVGMMMGLNAGAAETVVGTPFGTVVGGVTDSKAYFIHFESDGGVIVDGEAARRAYLAMTHVRIQRKEAGGMVLNNKVPSEAFGCTEMFHSLDPQKKSYICGTSFEDMKYGILRE